MSCEAWGSGDEFYDDAGDDARLDAGWLAPDDADQMRAALERCRTVLGNMAQEREGFWAGLFGRRWPINHEPLRADARNLLPILDEILGEPK
jgi:hypothetical protein